MTSIKEDKNIVLCIKTTRTSNKLVQLKLLIDIKDKLDKIFSTNDILTLFQIFPASYHKQTQALFFKFIFGNVPYRY